jgi:hypothetical protein
MENKENWDNFNNLKELKEIPKFMEGTSNLKKLINVKNQLEIQKRCHTSSKRVKCKTMKGDNRQLRTKKKSRICIIQDTAKVEPKPSLNGTLSFIQRLR